MNAVAVFPTTSAAMAVQDAADRGAVAGRMIPIPAKLSAGCGLAWCAPDDDARALRRALEAEGLAYEAVHVIEL